MAGIACRRQAKCRGDSASQYRMISFHLPPMAASAAVSAGSRRPDWAARPGGGRYLQVPS